MKNNIIKQFMDLPAGEEASRILQSCVHCGFCNATCPTYLELGDERDGPRGRIYLIKQFLEGESEGSQSRIHLDRCLSCLNCETTCPSGVQYGRLLDISRGLMEENLPRPLPQRLVRWLLGRVLPYTSRFAFLLSLGCIVRPILPDALAKKIPERPVIRAVPNRLHSRRMLMLQGCIQAAASPNTNDAAVRVLDRLGVQLIMEKQAGCCGAVNYHLGEQKSGLDKMRNNIDAWWPQIEGGGIEAIIVTASGCGAMVNEYGHLLRHDPDYSAKAERVSQLFRDLSQVLAEEDLTPLKPSVPKEKIAIHIPCTLQHALGQTSTVREIFSRLGFELAQTSEEHLCCGSAGTYSLLQPELSNRLQQRKLKALELDTPDVIATGNIGCQLHLQSGTDTPVQHWIELLDQ